MNLQQLKREYEHFKCWVRRSPMYYPAKEGDHVCICCGHHYYGIYCPYCSQMAGLGRITWRSVRDGVMDLWGMGTRSMSLSIWQLLYRPGYFISDYINGKRQLSFPPVKMLFIVAMIYANIFYWFFPDVLNMPLEEQGAVGYKLWIREHYNWAMLIMSAIAIFPTWVFFRRSPRNSHHTIPEGFFIQVFFQTLTIVLSLLTIPLDLIESYYTTLAYDLLIIAYYFVGYKQLFGHGIWGTLWRQASILLCVILCFIFLVWLAYPTMIGSVKDALKVGDFFFEYII